MNNNNNALMNIVGNVNEQQYMSFALDTIEDRKRVYNALNSPDARLGDVINMTIPMVDVVVRRVELSKRNEDSIPEEFKEMEENSAREGYRVVIFDKDGKTYTATSRGIYTSIQNILAILGTLHFEEPLNVIVRQISTKNGKTLTLELA